MQSQQNNNTQKQFRQKVSKDLLRRVQSTQTLPTTSEQSQQKVREELAMSDCLTCKLIAGGGFFLFGMSNLLRLSGGYFRTLALKEKIFQALGTFTIFGFSFSQFYIAYDLFQVRGSKFEQKYNLARYNPNNFGFFGRTARVFQQQKKSEEQIEQIYESIQRSQQATEKGD